MFLVTRVMTVDKGFVVNIQTNFLKHGLVDEFPGFIRKEVHVNERPNDHAIIRVLFYWRSKEDFIAWEKSPAHLAQHKAHAGQPRPIEIRSMVIETYEVYERSSL